MALAGWVFLEKSGRQDLGGSCTCDVKLKSRVGCRVILIPGCLVWENISNSDEGVFGPFSGIPFVGRIYHLIISQQICANNEYQMRNVR